MSYKNLERMRRNEFPFPKIKNYFLKENFTHGPLIFDLVLDLNGSLNFGNTNFNYRINNQGISSSLHYKILSNLDLKICRDGKISAFIKNNDVGIKVYVENDYISLGKSFAENGTDIDIYLNVSEKITIRGFFDRPSYATGFGVSFNKGKFTSAIYALKPMLNSACGFYWKVPDQSLRLLFSHKTQSHSLIAKLSLLGDTKLFTGCDIIRWKQFEFKGTGIILTDSPSLWTLSAMYKGQFLKGLYNPDVCFYFRNPFKVVSFTFNMELPKLGRMKTELCIKHKEYVSKADFGVGFFIDLDPITIYST